MRWQPAYACSWLRCRRLSLTLDRMRNIVSTGQPAQDLACPISVRPSALEPRGRAKEKSNTDSRQSETLRGRQRHEDGYAHLDGTHKRLRLAFIPPYPRHHSAIWAPQAHTHTHLHPWRRGGYRITIYFPKTVSCPRLLFLIQPLRANTLPASRPRFNSAGSALSDAPLPSFLNPPSMVHQILLQPKDATVRSQNSRPRSRPKPGILLVGVSTS